VKLSNRLVRAPVGVPHVIATLLDVRGVVRPRRRHGKSRVGAPHLLAPQVCAHGAAVVNDKLWRTGRGLHRGGRVWGV
jgi:hypothetical protein